MVKDGFSPPYAAGLTAGSALIGPIIPPSIFMIIYATMTNTSIGGLFAAGILPGLLLGGAFMAMNYVYSHRYQVPVADFGEVRKRKKEILTRSIVALFAPVIIVGGIVMESSPQRSRELFQSPTAFWPVFSTPGSSVSGFLPSPSMKRFAFPVQFSSLWAPPPL
jgi:hypothetical protein